MCANNEDCDAHFSEGMCRCGHPRNQHKAAKLCLGAYDCTCTASRFDDFGFTDEGKCQDCGHAQTRHNHVRWELVDARSLAPLRSSLWPSDLFKPTAGAQAEEPFSPSFQAWADRQGATSSWGSFGASTFRFP